MFNNNDDNNNTDNNRIFLLLNLYGLNTKCFEISMMLTLTPGREPNISYWKACLTRKIVINKMKMKMKMKAKHN